MDAIYYNMAQTPRFPKKIVIMDKWCKLYRAGEYQFFADACWFSELYRNTPG